ncbi:hypothetical protein [Embleya sp. NPDC020630]|uniref:hypothetical protein n=1 Tax=Embleya sp. NPDC020630 TaxID=3363979 RepID=UPI0037A00F4D
MSGVLRSTGTTVSRAWRSGEARRSNGSVGPDVGSTAQRLEESGGVDEALEVLRRAAREQVPYAAGSLALLLARIGRLDEAVEAVRPGSDGANCGCLMYGSWRSWSPAAARRRL